MSHLTYEPLHASDIPNIQAMTQGTPFSSMRFNTHAEAIMVARQGSQLVGLILGHKEYGDKSHILTIADSYLYHSLRDPIHKQEMQLAFINWAKNKLNVTHYRETSIGTIMPIGIDAVIPPLSVGNQSSQNIPSVEFSFS
jgi:hypothetical protein